MKKSAFLLIVPLIFLVGCGSESELPHKVVVNENVEVNHDVESFLVHTYGKTLLCIQDVTYGRSAGSFWCMEYKES